MIDSRELRRRVGDGQVVAVDSDGRDFDRSDVLTAPALLVGPVSDAVKRVRDERVTEDIDRNMLWLVRGIAVDRVVVDSLPDGSLTMSELIRRVEAAGHVWGTTLL